MGNKPSTEVSMNRMQYAAKYSQKNSQKTTK